MNNTVHHLDKALYANPKHTFRIHMGLRRKQESMTGEVATKASGLVKAYLAKYNIAAHAWIILPSRLSLIVQPTSAKTIFAIADDLQKLIKDRALPKDAEFYGDFLDHLLRKTEDPKHESAELVMQCVAAGIAPSPNEYAHCGSTQYPINELAAMNSPVLELAYAESK